MQNQALSWSGQQDSNLHQVIDFTTSDSDRPGCNPGAARPKAGGDSDTAEDEASVAADADAACSICQGKGWYWGWRAYRSGAKGRRIHPGKPVMLRCPCVDQNRAAGRTRA